MVLGEMLEPWLLWLLLDWWREAYSEALDVYNSHVTEMDGATGNGSGSAWSQEAA